MTDFLLTLQSDLPKVSPQSLESVFGQCMYFGLSFGRVGSDFRVLLIPLFAQVAFDRFDNATNKTELQFSEAVSSFSLARTGSSLSSNSSLYTQGPPLSADQVQPPYSLMKFAPLVELCNEIIAAFNELRLCAPVQLVEPVTRKLDRTFQGCSQILADFQRHEKEAFTLGEEQEFSKCLQLYQQDFLPFVEKIIHLMFSTPLISAQTGFPSSEITKQELGVLNKQYILQPISHLLIKEEPVIIVVPTPQETVDSLPSSQEAEKFINEAPPVDDVSTINNLLIQSESEISHPTEGNVEVNSVVEIADSAVQLLTGLEVDITSNPIICKNSDSNNLEIEEEPSAGSIASIVMEPAVLDVTATQEILPPSVESPEMSAVIPVTSQLIELNFEPVDLGDDTSLENNIQQQ